MVILFSAADLINVALKQWVFTKADFAYEYRMEPPTPVFEDEQKFFQRIDDCEEKCVLTEEEKLAFEKWSVAVANYEGEQKIDRTIYERQRSAVRDLSLLIVAIPLFLLHWRIVRKESKKA